MKKKELEQLKQILEDEKRKIQRHLEDISDSSVADIETPSGDSVDLASLEINQNSLAKVGKRELNHLKKRTNRHLRTNHRHPEIHYSTVARENQRNQHASSQPQENRVLHLSIL